MSIPADIQALALSAIDATSEIYVEAIARQLAGQRSEFQWKTIEAVMYRALVLGELIGIETEYNKVKLLGVNIPAKRRFAKAEIPHDDVFKPAAFNEAIDAFQERVPIMREQLPRIAEEAARRARSIVSGETREALAHLAKSSRAINEALRNTFYVADSDMATTLNLKELVSQALRGTAEVSGLPLPEFVQQAQLQGARNLTAARLETVFRNNVTGAMVDGQSAILSTPEAKRVVPLVMIVASKDRRTRGNPAGLYPEGFHYQMSGYINTIEYFEIRGIKPPCGHNCRCSIRGVTNFEAIKLGIIDDESGAVIPAKLAEYNGDRQAIIDRGDYPDPGWSVAAA